MARALNKLTAMWVAKAKEPGKYADGGGLYLQITAAGGKSWLFRFMLDGRAREMGLGAVSSVSLQEARRRAAEARERASAGIDPIDARERDRAQARAAAASVMTFSEAAEALIKSREPGWKNPKHIAQWRSTLATYAAPVIGRIPVDLVDISHVMKILEPIWISKTETASRVRGRIEAVLDWATVRKMRSGENPARWKGNLDVLLPARATVQAVQHHTALPYGKIGAFMADLRTREATAARALEFTILTAARTREATEARWGEMDLERGLWTVPAERMKAGREHRVPLSKQAIAVLMSMQSGTPRSGDVVFPAPQVHRGKVDPPLSDMAMLTLLRRMHTSKETTVHGFRSTFKDWASECTAYPNEMSEAALAHIVGDKTEAAYRRGDLFEKRRRMMQDWADYCDRPVVSAGVVPIRAR